MNEKLRELVEEAIEKASKVFGSLYLTGLEDYEEDEDEKRFAKEVVAELFSHPDITIQLGGWIEARQEGEEEPVVSALLGLMIDGKTVEADMAVYGEYDQQTGWTFYWDAL